MLSMAWFFVIFSALLLGGGVAYTVLWFRQAEARMQQARARRAGENKGWRRL
jgi:hypothetical protein